MCKEHKQAVKKLDLWKLPKYLIIHLKRFTVNGSFREKNEDMVDFPLVGLDISGRVLGNQSVPPVYNLYAISVMELSRL